MAQNPNWPLLQVLWSPTTNAVFDSNSPIYTDITLRCLKQWQVQTGRQYELDQMQPGTFQTTLNNRDGAFNPVSTLSPFAPGVLPERSIKLQAQWPPTANLLTGDLATSGETSGVTGSIPASWHVSSDVGATLSIVASGTAFQGTQVFQAVVPASITTNFYILRFNFIPVSATTVATPAVTYTWSTNVRCTTSGINPQVSAEIKWLNAAGATVSATPGSTVTLTGSATASWTRVTASGRPPAGAVCAILAVAARGTTPASTWTFQQDGSQHEAAASASTWTAPGTWYPIYAGNVERYPNVYDLSGTRALAQIEASDPLGLLSQTAITGSLDGLIGNPAGDNSVGGAVFEYALGEPAGSTSFSDSLGNRGSANVFASKAGPGTISPGTAVTSQTVGLGFVGVTQTVTEFSAPGGAGGSTSAAMSAIAVPAGSNGMLGPGGGTGLGYTRMIAFKCRLVPSTNGSVLWYSAALGNFSQGVALLPGGIAVVAMNDANHSGTTAIGNGYDVNNWHIAWLGVAADGSSFTAGIDNVIASTSAGASNFNYPAGFLQDIMGAQGASASVPSSLMFNFFGDMALFVEWPELLTIPQMTSIYQAWRTGYSGDSSGQRAGHILGWAGYKGATAIDTGVSTSLGPAIDVVDTDAVTALQATVTTEGGEHFMAPDGTYTFYARSRRLGAYSPMWSFGSNTAGGEIPFEDVQFDFDPTLIENDVTNTQVSTGQNFYSVNETSGTVFGKRTLTQSNQSSNAQEVQDQADWYAGVYGYPRIRVASLTLHPAANPSVLWPVCLALRLGQYVKVTQRPMGAGVGVVDPVTMTGFVENITITGQDTADATWVLQISADVASGAGPSQPALEPWNLALLHTTLHTSVSAGTNTITIDALPTAATSTLAQNLPQGGPGFQLTIGDGLATQETLTIASVSTTVLGYTTATVTFTTNLAHNHTAGEVIRENLGGASPTTWQSLDAYSTLGTCMITY